MKKNIAILSICVALFSSCKDKTSEAADIKVSETIEIIEPQIDVVTEFKGQQVTGVTLSDSGRIFVNFPRWRKGVTNSVMEIKEDGQQVSYPNDEWNSWEIDLPVSDKQFVGVQSVVAFENRLYVVDTRSPLFQNVLDAPRVYVFNFNTDELVETIILNSDSYFKDSYINDLRVDKENNKIYLTDSGHAGLVIVDLKTKKSTRVLTDHTSTTAEVSSLTFNNKVWNNTVHSDGIALDTKSNRLYYHALTGYSLYSISTDSLGLSSEIEKNVKLEAKTAAPDGMIFDQSGNLYYADLENNKIQYRKPDGSIHTLVEGDKVKWADTFSIYNNYLYFTNSRINEVTPDISEMSFTVNKVLLPID